MLNFDQPLRKYTLAIVRSFKDSLRDSRGVESDTGQLYNSIKMRQQGLESEIYAMAYSWFLRDNKDFNARRTRSRATHGGFLQQAIDQVPEREQNRFLDSVATEILNEFK